MFLLLNPHLNVNFNKNTMIISPDNDHYTASLLTIAKQK